MTKAFTSVLTRVRLDFIKRCIRSGILLLACLIILNPAHAAKNGDNKARELTELDIVWE